MSVKRRHQRIHTGIKVVGIKTLDDLFKNAVIPLAECIQLRAALDTAQVVAASLNTLSLAMSTDRVVGGEWRCAGQYRTTGCALVAQPCSNSGANCQRWREVYRE